MKSAFNIRLRHLKNKNTSAPLQSAVGGDKCTWYMYSVHMDGCVQILFRSGEIKNKFKSQAE